jgi:hypothetical protein
MGPAIIGACVAAVIVLGLCLRRMFFKPQPAAFGTMREDFKFSIDHTDFQGDGSKRLPEVDDEFDIDTELQQQLERTRADAFVSRRMEEGGSGREGVSLLGELTSDAQVNQEAFEAEMRAELAEFDQLAAEESVSESAEPKPTSTKKKKAAS